MKILIADFKIAKYGGIVEHVVAKVKALKSLGHDVDIVQLCPKPISQASFDKRIKELSADSYNSKLVHNSQNGGYELDEATGYWKNCYYGFFLPPSNVVGVYEPDALKKWKSLTSDVDLIMWNFMPTKNGIWFEDKNNKDFSFWWKFYDLPTDRTKQIFIVHDSYFDVRASNVSALRDKILFLECAHIAAYQCCEHIGIPRTLLLNPRFFDKDSKMPIKMMDKRKYDFFAAHMFKSMKHMEDLIRAIPYINPEEGEELNGQPFPFSVRLAGSGIEQAYMVADKKIKPAYVCDRKRDPDLPKELDGKEPIWVRGERHGMEYLGQISPEDVNWNLLNSKFAIDPSWCKHYAQYCRTHINGFIIEAMLNGCYPVLRDYRGLVKKEVDDPIFENIKAVIIPWDATPKQFAKALHKASCMSPKQYLRDTKYNYDFVKELFNAEKNMSEVIKLVQGGKKLVKKECELGKDSEKVVQTTKEIMEDFFDIELPIMWRTD